MLEQKCLVVARRKYCMRGGGSLWGDPSGREIPLGDPSKWGYLWDKMIPLDEIYPMGEILSDGMASIR